MVAKARRLESVQALRAVAAMFVVGFHALGMTARAGWPAPVPFGAFGVDIFFVISGFVMVLTTQRPTTPGRFLGDRIARIVPLYWAVTTAKVAIMLAVPTLGALKFHLPHVIASYAFMPWLDQLGEPYPVVYVGWTLNYEMFFYLAFAGLALNPNRLAVAFGIAVLAGLAIDGPLIWRTWTDPILLEFLMGLAIGLAFVGKPWAVPAIVACLALTMPANRVFYWGIPSAVLVAACVALNRHWPRTILSKIGDSSYALYLTHVTVLPIFYRIASRFLAMFPSWLVILLAMTAAVAIGHLVHLVIERNLSLWTATARRSYQRA